jgi:starch synthase
MGLEVAADRLLIGVVSRLTAQKGIDLLLQALPQVIPQGVQLALLGSGDVALESGMKTLVQRHPGAVAVHFGYDEALAHRIIAGADMVGVPSRFEPCGLTQLYALRYGALPLVRRVGGLADTVVDATDAARADGTATGFVFDAATSSDVVATIRRALELQRNADAWLAMMRSAIAQDFSWRKAAAAYQAIYEALAREPG